MDDTINSVYITGKLKGYSGKTRNGGECSGSFVGHMGQGCNNLNGRGKRIKCVRQVAGLP
ncbi:hypothetical protein C8A00DRAFT_18812 [Chaetomidium leptoderma]|uniref:Uncharacterized protein n=1 Tax=Chaetomidium leptoderma TaxID=669021 RepID=A0AAN6ZUL5_9PEZI|nr:hypothetical protein C8A00DRAFT_18812 [Chaetomidium leptoderma]